MTVGVEVRALPLGQLNALGRDAFVAHLGDVFEHSPWVAERAWEARPFGTIADLHGAMVDVVLSTDLGDQRALIDGHPDLAGRLALVGQLTDASHSEQASAGLDQCSPDELACFQDLNTAYRAKFGFPFVMAVKGRSRADILAAFATRLEQEPAQEFQVALNEIAKIAHFRLVDIVDDRS